jgi:hypothetical protein
LDHAEAPRGDGGRAEGRSRLEIAVSLFLSDNVVKTAIAVFTWAGTGGISDALVPVITGCYVAAWSERARQVPGRSSGSALHRGAPTQLSVVASSVRPAHNVKGNERSLAERSSQRQTVSAEDLDGRPSHDNPGGLADTEGAEPSGLLFRASLRRRILSRTAPGLPL